MCYRRTKCNERSKYNGKLNYNDNLTRAINFVDSKSAQIIRNNLVPGIVVGITNAEETIYELALGYSDIEEKIPMTYETTILLASVSKPISGTLLCLLQRQRNTDILNKKTRIVMSEKYVTRNMTVRYLVSHHSGIPPQYGTTNELVGYTRHEIINNLVNVPNENFRYTFNYT